MYKEFIVVVQSAFFQFKRSRNLTHLIFVKSPWYFLIIFHVRAYWVTYYQVTGPDSASAAIAAAAPKSRMKLISNTQRMAHKLRETWLPNC